VPAVGQQLDDRGLVGDQRTRLAGVGGEQREPDDGSAAAAEYVRRFAAERGQQAVHVVGLLLGRHVMGGVLAAAVAGAARVIRHDGVVVGERAGESGEASAVHRRADHEQQWAGAALLLVEPCAGHVQGMSRRIGVGTASGPSVSHCQVALQVRPASARKLICGRVHGSHAA
jgi:hypothetical protein